jgi:hypothetical protein
MRASLAVFTGYLIFAGSAVAFFHLLNVDPHSPAAMGFEVLTIVYGLAFALLAGFVTGKIARRMDLRCGIALALVIALGAMISMIARPGSGALWTQTAALILFAPAAFVGAWLHQTLQRPKLSK